MPDNMDECHGCGEEHSDWGYDGSHTVDDGQNSGTVKRWECDNCGEITEVPHY